MPPTNEGITDTREKTSEKIPGSSAQVLCGRLRKVTCSHSAEWKTSYFMGSGLENAEKACLSGVAKGNKLLQALDTIYEVLVNYYFEGRLLVSYMFKP